MKEFDAHLILSSCCPNPLGEENKDGNIYRMAFPYDFCCWGRGFYFQPILVEFDFNMTPRHASKKTYFLPSWKPEFYPPKIIGELDGSKKEYPVLGFYICVNRSLFPTLSPGQNELEWLQSMTQRTKGIAHELVYAKQYYRNFDPATGALVQEIELVTVDKEEALLCPTWRIEHFLHSVEKGYKTQFVNGSDFKSKEGTEAVQKYFELWLKKLGVEKEICHRATCQYLDSPMRDHHRKMQDCLERCAKKHGFDGMDSRKLKLHIHRDSIFIKEYLQESTINGHYSDEVIIEHTLVLIDRKNGH